MIDRETQLNLSIPSELRRAFKACCAKQGITMKEGAKVALEEYLERHGEGEVSNGRKKDL